MALDFKVGGYNEAMNDVPRAHARLIDVLPPPTYLELPSVGIVIRDTAIRFAEMIRIGTKARLGRFGEIPLPPGIVSGGTILDASRLQEVLQKLKRRFRFEFVRSTILEEHAYLFTTSVSSGDEESIRHSLQHALAKNVPLPLSEVSFDYDAIGVHRAEGIVDVAVTVVPKRLLRSYAEAFSRAGFSPLSFELEGQAIARAVVSNADQATRMIVDLGRKRTTVSIVAGNVVVFTSTFQTGSNQFDSLVAARFNLEPAELVRIKHERGVLRTRENEELFSIVAGFLSGLKDEINRCIEYWNTHGGKVLPGQGLRQLLLSGEGAAIAGLATYLEGLLGLPVREGDVWVNAVSPEIIVPELAFAHSLQYASTLGSALRSDF
jgi:type IV pilus assembly protein PilM